MKIAITGGMGFIGGHVVDALAAAGHELTIVDVVPPKESGEIRWAEYRCAFATTDLREWNPHFTGFEAVVHLAAFGGVARAAREPFFVFGSNALATANLVKQCKRFPRLRSVVHLSSFSVYGAAWDALEEHPKRVRTGEPIRPLEVYGASKAAQELAFVGSGLPLLTLRCSSVYGRRMRLEDPEATILAKIAGWISRGQEVELFEDGEQTRDFVHVFDVVAAIRAGIEGCAGSGGLVNVCTGESTTLVRAAETIGLAMGNVPRIRRTHATRPGDMRHCLGDPSGLESLLGYKPLDFNRGAYQAFGAP